MATKEYVHDLMNASEDELLAREEASLDRLEKFMGLAEIAEFIVDTAGPETMAAAMKKLETERPDSVTRYNEPFGEDIDEDIEHAPFDYDDVDYPMDTDQLLDALEETLENSDEDTLLDLVEKLKTRRKARLNRVRSSDVRSPLNSTRGKFRKLVNTAADEFRYKARQAAHGVATESFDIIADGEELEALSLSLNERASKMLQTAAQKSIEGKLTPSAKSVADMLPKEWNKSSTDDYNMPVVPDFKTASFLPPEFANPKITATVDRSFTAAAKTIERSSKIDFEDQEDDRKLPDYWKRVKAADTATNVPGADTYKPAFKDEARQAQYDVETRNLASRRDGNQPPLSNR